jgi:hypothetical protein
MYKKILVFTFLVSLSSIGISQTINSEYNTRIFNAKVKQLNEFFDRFNYVVDIESNKVDSYFKSKVSREDYVRSLFNEKDHRVKDNNFNAIKEDFIHFVVNDSIKINKYSNDIIAEARSSITRNNKDENISIFLKQEIVDRQFVKWVIHDIRADFFSFEKSDSAYQKFIQPTSHETNFINLKRILADKEDLLIYAYSDYQVDQLSLFFYELNREIIKYKQVEELIYHITDIPGWYIQVKEFKRNTENSGWLINDLKKLN